ncbi:PucR family transcriptional regulator ligand-binding domain-containing protein [Lentzea sp. BCCO 10_0856]|uniref:PucR family transcriptional regulator ligand-binding domain-containing protein n=1 Tax=Lentzea miocenica TaxID=3095431 RepID=A0ABU4TCB9_9PSEU|nr:PucR family transcriptional regulator ligand-binding domain-containing protein [Lentzea sp. BCCO 10_0856]MDX8035821.1 PucR family transcriptional regulator ligand-binding domain-containing protein [Lentzea sp. BCCO 10_0856]
MYPTVAEVVALPVIRQGKPRLVAGSAGLSRRVRWVHVAEIADIAPLLRGGELVLTTGVMLPESGLARYIEELAAVGCAGLVIELGRRWRDDVPAALVTAAEHHGLPLLTLAEETKYVAVTEAVVALIVDAQLAELRAAEQVHETFTSLTVAGAEPSEVLREVARTSGLAVVLETLGHDVLAYDAAGHDPVTLLDDWAARSRAVTVTERTAYHVGSGWLITIVGARGADWGRLVMVSPEPPPHRHVVVAERAASALAVHRLVARDRESLERQTHRTLLAQLLGQSAQSPDLGARAAALGVPLERRQLIGVAIRPVSVLQGQTLATQEVLRDLAEATALAGRRVTVAALVGVVDDTSVRALLSVPMTVGVEGVLRKVAREIHRTAASPVVIAVGTTVTSTTDVRRSLGEAAHVAGAALRAPGSQLYHRLDDVRLRGLLHLLREDERVRAFADRELGPLLARDSAQGSRLVELLRCLCENGGNKSAAAGAAHLSRTAYYQQLARIEQVLGVSLEDPESVLSLYVALLVHEMGP